MGFRLDSGFSGFGFSEYRGGVIDARFDREADRRKHVQDLRAKRG